MTYADLFPRGAATLNPEQCIQVETGLRMLDVAKGFEPQEHGFADGAIGHYPLPDGQVLFL